MSTSNHSTNKNNPFWWLSSILVLIFWCLLSALFSIGVVLGIFFVFIVPNLPEEQEMNIQKHGTNEVGIAYKVITLKDGRQIEYVKILGGDVGGVSCNLNNPVNQKATQHNQQ